MMRTRREAAGVLATFGAASAFALVYGPLIPVAHAWRAAVFAPGLGLMTSILYVIGYFVGRRAGLDQGVRAGRVSGPSKRFMVEEAKPAASMESAVMEIVAATDGLKLRLRDTETGLIFTVALTEEARSWAVDQLAKHAPAPTAIH